LPHDRQTSRHVPQSPSAQSVKDIHFNTPHFTIQ
jgi:hypothetical protein